MKIIYSQFQKSVRFVACILYALPILSLNGMDTLEVNPPKIINRDDIKKSPTECGENEFFVHEDNILSSGICVPNDVIELSNTLKMMIQDVPSNEKVISLPFPLLVIRHTFDILKMIKNSPHLSTREYNHLIIKKLAIRSLDRMINVIKCLDFLDCPIVNQVINDACTAYLKNLVIDSNIKNKTYGSFDVKATGLIMPLVVFSPDSKMVVFAGTNLLLIDASGGQILHQYAQDVTSAAFSPDGTTIASGSFGGHNNLIVWNAKTGQKLFDLIGHPAGVNALAFSPDGTTIVSGSRDNHNNLIVWDAKTGQKLLDLIGHPTDVTSVGFSPDGTKIVSGAWGDQNNLIVWDAKTGQKLLDLIGHPAEINSVAFSPNGTTIASGSRGNRNNLIVWDAKTGQKLLDLIGHPTEVTSVGCSPDGTKLVSGSAENQNNLLVWDLQTGKMLLNRKTLFSDTISVAFSPDGTKLGAIFFELESALSILNLCEKTEILDALSTCSFEQKQLVYLLSLQLVSNSIKLKIINDDQSNEAILFNSLPLPDYIKKLMLK